MNDKMWNDDDGTLYQECQTQVRAWHAGRTDGERLDDDELDDVVAKVHHEARERIRRGAAPLRPWLGTVVRTYYARAREHDTQRDTALARLALIEHERRHQREGIDDPGEVWDVLRAVVMLLPPDDAEVLVARIRFSRAAMAEAETDGTWRGVVDGQLA